MNPTPPSADFERDLIDAGVMLQGHFVLSSGRHSGVYFEKFRILEQPAVLGRFCASIAEHFRGKADLVAGPTTGGLIVAFEVARHLGVDARYVESVKGVKTLRRNATIPIGAKVLVVDDVLTTGLSTRETVQALQGLGAEVIGAGVLIDRSESDCGLEVPLFAAHRVEARSYAEDELPPELAAIPVTKPGTRA